MDDDTGTVYGAGGLAHYDGTYVVAVDGSTGELKEPGQARPSKDMAREVLRRRGKEEKPKTRWIDTQQRRFTSFIVSEASQQLLATGHPDDNEEEPFLVATKIEDGKDVWIEPLPAVAVKGGTAIDSAGRIFISLENGELVCYRNK